MNSLVIPPSPNWYETSILACAPDNTLIYGARNDLVVIEPSSSESPCDVKIISRAHSQRITSVHTNKNWAQPHKLAVSVAEDKIVKLWNLQTLTRKSAHNVHLNDSKVVGATFAGDDRVVSVSENGVINIWNITSDESTQIKELLGTKITVTCLSTCPHANWLTAFGLKNGLVVVADLRRTGKILYKLRGHDKAVLTLSWCPAPVNVFPKDPKNIVVNKKVQGSVTDEPEATITEVISDVADGKSNETPEIVPEVNEAETQIKSEQVPEISTKEVTAISVAPVTPLKQNPWINLVHADDDEVPAGFADQGRHIPVHFESSFDFLEECNDLKSQILNGCTEVLANPTIASKEGNVPSIIETKFEGEKIGTDPGKEVPSEGGDVSHVIETKSEGIDIGKEASSSVGVCGNDSEDTKKMEGGENKVARYIGKSEPDMEQPRKEFLLASSGKESNIYIWRAGTDGRMQTFFTTTRKTGGYRKSLKSNDRIWVTICWVSPNILLSSDKSGELLQWTIPKPRDVNKQVRVLHRDHSSLFSIAAPITLTNECNWFSSNERELNAWTVGIDRLLLNTSLCSKRTNLGCYSTFGGAITAMAASLLDPTRLAIGSGDGLIRMWDLSRPHVKHISMSNYYQKIQSRVECLAWHPTQENMLAYGTMEGRIGILDPTNPSKSPHLMPHYFKTQIHCLEWGPLNDNKHNLGLYATSQGKLVVFNVKKPEEQNPIEIDVPENVFVYLFTWHPSFTHMLISTKTGSLLVYSSDLKLLNTHYMQQKFHKILWHSDAGTNNKHCNWFGVLVGGKTLMIYEFLQKEDNVTDIVKVATLANGHSELINSFAWNPYVANQIVSVGEDGIAQLWDIETKTILSTYVNANMDNLLNVLWSPCDTDLILVGGKDFTIKICKISGNSIIHDKEIEEKRKNIINEIVTESLHLLPKLEAPVEEKSRTKKSKNCLLPVFYASKEKASEAVADLRKFLEWKENGGSVDALAGGDAAVGPIDIFGDNQLMIRLLEKNKEKHRSKGKHSLDTLISLWKGDISTSVNEAINGNRVTPWIISLAPMVSPKLWQKACEVYAEQLTQESDQDPLEIAMYYLACHKVESAINVLCEENMYREALALAKARFCDEDVVTQIIQKWAGHSFLTGAFETAAQCYIALGQYEKAATVLFRRMDAEMLKFAGELAEKTGNEELHKAILFRYNEISKEQQEQSVMQLPSLVDSILNTAQKDNLNLETKSELSCDIPKDVNGNNDKLESKTENGNKSNLEDSGVVSEEVENSDKTPLTLENKLE